MKTLHLLLGLVSALGTESPDKLDQLNGLSGPEFDRTYVSMQVDAHQQAVRLFEAYAEAGDNPELQKWAKNTLPALQGHLNQAKELNSELKTAETADQDRQRQARSGAQHEQHEQPEQPKRQGRTFQFVERQNPTDWSAEALIGRTVENPQEEELGPINNVIINEKGDVVAVTIGVGGFLGIGQKDVGVPFDALEFVPEERMTDAETARGQTAEETQQKDRAPQDEAAARYDAEHSNVRILLNATREQLEAAPEFVWLGD